ncbi:TIGR03643 family protein [Flavobacterium sp.]|uniref:TIGR03643 family protein n=1 Tax=Flavobacterium sp. TaxID=239 RepID=UPI0025ED6B1A|nr:TIGR03643 family protein [Flavobacterium sp.]
MKKSRLAELSIEELERLVSMAQEERKPFEVIKEEFGLSENEVTELMRKRLSKDKFELWKKKAVGSKPKPKPILDDLDDLDSKYYIKNKFD